MELHISQLLDCFLPREQGANSQRRLTGTVDLKPEKVVVSALAAGGFPADVGEGGVNLAIPLVSAVAYVYPG